MTSLNALSSRRSPIGEVLRQVVRGCSSRRTMYHHRSSPFSACDSQSNGSAKPNEVCLSTTDATSIVGCNSGFYVGKRSEGKVSLPLCSLTIWYYRYALTLHTAKPDPAYAWHSELNTSLRTTTRNHNSEPTKSIRHDFTKQQKPEKKFTFLTGSWTKIHHNPKPNKLMELAQEIII